MTQEGRSHVALRAMGGRCWYLPTKQQAPGISRALGMQEGGRDPYLSTTVQRTGIARWAGRVRRRAWQNGRGRARGPLHPSVRTDGW